MGKTAQASISKIRKHVHAHRRKFIVATDDHNLFCIRGMKFFVSRQNASKEPQLSARQCWENFILPFNKTSAV